MMVVPTFVAPSAIHGLGCFTAVDIKKGDTVWVLDPLDKIVSDDDVKSMSAAQMFNICKFIYFDDGLRVLCSDDARYVNHSDNPSFDGSGIINRALRDIKAGDELTMDYRVFDIEPLLTDDWTP